MFLDYVAFIILQFSSLGVSWTLTSLRRNSFAYMRNKCVWYIMAQALLSRYGKCRVWPNPHPSAIPFRPRERTRAAQYILHVSQALTPPRSRLPFQFPLRFPFQSQRSHLAPAGTCQSTLPPSNSEKKMGAQESSPRLNSTTIVMR